MARYDSRTTTFSPEGRLFQVEYAMAAIQNSGASVGIRAHDSVILAVEKKDISKLLAVLPISDKIYRLDDHVVCAVAGLTADANVLVSYLRRSAQHYRASFQEPQPVDDLLKKVCDLKQGYTQFGGQRPFGVAFLYAGYDYANGVQLYHSDPTGNYAAWNARAIGKFENEANQLLTEEMKVGEELSTDDAKVLAVKAFRKILDLNDDLEKQMEMLIITKQEGKEGMDITKVSDEELMHLNQELVTAEANKAKP